MLKFVYSMFLGLLVVVFVGMGIASFYPSPKMPDYPKTLQHVDPSKDYTAEQHKQDDAYQQSYKSYSLASASYNRDVSMIVLGAAVLLLVAGLALHTRISALADGLLLGGTFTLIYSIGRSFNTDDPKYSFMVVSVGLVVTMVVGYLKFVRPQAAQTVAKKK
jgi:hypothetical protein